MPVGAPIEPIVIAEHGTIVVAEVGPRILLIDRGRVPTEVHVLLLTMSALIFGGFGIVSLIYTGAGAMDVRSTVIGIGLLTIGAGSFVAMTRAVRALHDSRATPLATLRPSAVFDREAGVYLDGQGEAIAPLSEIRFSRTGFGVSKLVVFTLAGERVLAAGNPVTGGVGNLDRVLTDAVATRPRRA